MRSEVERAPSKATKMNNQTRKERKNERNQKKKMILAMEYICRQINDEDVLEGWLMNGVADGDLDTGEWDIEKVDEYYTKDENFADLMGCFLRRMNGALKSGGLYCDGIVTKEGNNNDTEATIGIYGSEVPGCSTVEDIVSYLQSKNLTVTDVNGDMDYGWEMNVSGIPRDIYFAVCEKIPGYKRDSVQEFIDEYEIEDA